MNRVLVRDMWPPGHKLVKDIKTIDQLNATELVPEDLEALMNWAYVRHFSARRNRSYSLLHTTPTTQAGTVNQVAFRVQGYVQECTLHPLGDWKG